MVLLKDKIKDAKSKAKGISPTVRIGKNGLTAETISEIKKQLVKRKIVKIKYLKSFDDREDSSLAEEIANKTNSIIIDKIGFTLTFLRKS